ncbi:MAG: rhodanese-like domain-containing protein [Pseudomonadota bacterium]
MSEEKQPALAVGYQALLDAANAEIETLDVNAAAALLDDDGAVFVDIRDPRELEREGQIPGAVHAPRGMLEFWIDPASPYYREVFGSGKRLVFYCQSGWRSALATKTVQDMGLKNVCHIDGGFRSWKAAGQTVVDKAARRS